MEHLFASTYGYFRADGREYVITTPFTPRPWGNVISNGDYAMMVSQTGSGYSWRNNAGQNRITRSFQDLIQDNWGKYLYLRDLDSGQYWAATYKPTCHQYDHYQVRHGLGYSSFEQIVQGIHSILTVFVAPDDPVEIFQLTLTNQSDRQRRLDITSYVEWLLGFALMNTVSFTNYLLRRRLSRSFMRCWRANICGGLPMNWGATIILTGPM